MKENTDEKSLVKINKNSIFYKTKLFFKNLFSRNESIVTDIPVPENNIVRSDENKNNTFMEEIKKIEDEETVLLKLQKQYRAGEIKEEDMTEEQINSLCDLYDKQIAKLKKSNNLRKQKLLEYRKKLQTEQ